MNINCIMTCEANQKMCRKCLITIHLYLVRNLSPFTALLREQNAKRFYVCLC